MAFGLLIFRAPSFALIFAFAFAGLQVVHARAGILRSAPELFRGFLALWSVGSCLFVVALPCLLELSLSWDPVYKYRFS